MAEELSILIRVKNLMQGGFDSAIASVNGFRQRVSNGIMGALGSMKAMVAGLAGAGGALGLFTLAIKKAFEFERYKTQFQVLLGSVDAAKKHFQELKDFASVTPFNLSEIAQASKTMLAMSGGVLGYRQSLLLVGDAAAAVGQPIQELGMWVARAYGAIRNGQPFGEAAMRLQEMGVLGGEARKKMEDLQAAGASNAAVWAVLTAELEKSKGGMDKLSQTGEGLISTLKDNWDSALAAFGERFTDLGKDKIAGLIEWLGKLESDGSIDVWATGALEKLGLVQKMLAGFGKGFVAAGTAIGDAAGVATTFAEKQLDGAKKRFQEGGGGVIGTLKAINVLSFLGTAKASGAQAMDSFDAAKRNEKDAETKLRADAALRARIEQAKKDGAAAGEASQKAAEARKLKEDLAKGETAKNDKKATETVAAINALADKMSQNFGEDLSGETARLWAEEETKKNKKGETRTTEETAAAVEERFRQAGEVYKLDLELKKKEKDNAQTLAITEAERQQQIAEGKVEPRKKALELATARRMETTNQRQERERNERQTAFDDKRLKSQLAKAKETEAAGGHLTRQQKLLLEEAKEKGRLADAQRIAREKGVETEAQKRARQTDQALNDIQQIREKLNTLLTLK